MVKIYNKIIYWLRLFEKVLLIGIHKICLNSVYFIFFLSVIFIIFLYTGMTSCYHLWPVDPIGGFLLMIMAPGLFFIMMGILILGINWVVGIFCFGTGFSMIPIMAIGLELGVELTYPIDESFSTGILMSSG